uniref:Uncharacterized protein n=1 Tax=Acrobeloides nanus TaxID=290746 RepID=A0A914DZ36_9BILA
MLRRPLSSITLKPADIDQMDGCIAMRVRHAIITEDNQPAKTITATSTEKEDIKKRVTAMEEPQPSSSRDTTSS